MNDPWNEDERLAAFLDGRLDAHERVEMLSRLVEDDEAYEVFAGLAAILLRAEVEDAGTKAAADRVIALRARQGVGKRASLRGWIALAAVLASVALVSGPALRARMSLAGDAVHLAARSEYGSDGLPAGWNEPVPWSSSR